MTKFLFPINYIGRTIIDFVFELGQMCLLFAKTCYWTTKKPFRWKLIFEQMEFIGVRSLFIIILTSAFTGFVFALQAKVALSKFQGESLTGTVVALSLTKELAPVLTALMVTARAGSAMAAQIGTMKVTEQIDALRSLAVEPISYLIVPRIIATIIMVPILTGIFDIVGITGSYIVGVKLLGINAASFIGQIEWYVDAEDIFHGIFKSFFFAIILSLVGCYKGYTTSGGAQGVGQATTKAVVIASVAILIADYFLTALLIQ